MAQTLNTRDTVYGADLRVPPDDTPSLTGPNQWTGTQLFSDLTVGSLHVTNLLELFTSSFQAYASAGVPFTFGTQDAQDFDLISNNTIREQLTSAGAIIFASAVLSSVTSTTLFSDNFNRANVSPLDQWTVQPALSSFQLSAQKVIPINTGSRSMVMRPNGATWAGNMVVQADVSALARQEYISLNVMQASSGPSGYFFQLGDGGSTTSASLRLIKYVVATGVITTLTSFTSAMAAGAPHTVTLIASGSSAATALSALIDGVLKTFAVDVTNPLTSGYPGIGGTVTPANASATLDNFAVLSTTPPPVSAEDLVFQASSQWYALLGNSTINRFLQVYPNLIQFGDQSDYNFVGIHSVTVSAGTSAFFPTSTYGVVNGISSVGVGTLGYLSGVVALSSDILQPSAVTGNVVWLPGFVVRGLSGAGTGASGLSGIVALSGGSGITVSAVVASNLLFVSGTSLVPSASFAATAASASAGWMYAGSSGFPGIVFPGTSTGFFTPSAGILRASVSGIERLHLNAEGSLGVGSSATAILNRANATFITLKTSASNMRATLELIGQDRTVSGNAMGVIDIGQLSAGLSAQGVSLQALTGNNPGDGRFTVLTASANVTHTGFFLDERQFFAFGASLPAGKVHVQGDVSAQLVLDKCTVAVAALAGGQAQLRIEAGTSAGTAKLVMYAGTATSGFTIADNVGSGF